MVFRVFSDMCNHHNFRTLYHFKKKIPYPLAISLLCLPPSVPPSPAAAAAKSLQLCPTLCNPIDGSLQGPAVPGILQARTLEWVAISSSNA